MFNKDDYWEEEFRDYKDKTLEGIYFDNCIFVNCDFSKSNIFSCKFTECRFINCDLSLSSIKASTFNDVAFKNSRLLGLSWSACEEPFDVSFDSCNLSSNSFHLLDLRQMHFLDSQIHDSGFEECNLEKALFDKCDLTHSVFIKNNLKKANFESSKNYLIDPSQNEMKDARFSLPEALSFLSLFPIKIK